MPHSNVLSMQQIAAVLDQKPVPVHAGGVQPIFENGICKKLLEQRTRISGGGAFTSAELDFMAKHAKMIVEAELEEEAA